MIPDSDSRIYFVSSIQNSIQRLITVVLGTSLSSCRRSHFFSAQYPVSKAVSHFSKSISLTTTFWESGLGFFGIRVVLRGKLGLYAGVRFWRNGLWRSGVQPYLEVCT